MKTKASLFFLVAFVLTGCWSTPHREPSWDRPATSTATPTTMATPTATIKPTATVPPTVKIMPTAKPTLEPPTPTPVLVWVRQDEIKVNPGNHPLGWDYGEDQRRKESYVKWEVGERSFVSTQKYQEDENLWYDGVIVQVVFSRPPEVLWQGQSYKLSATFSHSGGVLNYGYERLGEVFFWSGGVIEPLERFSYYPWAESFDGQNTKGWLLTGPPIGKLGDTFDFSAAMMNWPPGQIVWTYKVEEH